MSNNETKEVQDLALRYIGEQQTKTVVIQKLIDQGYSANLCHQIVSQLFKEIKYQRRIEGLKIFGVGFLIFALSGLHIWFFSGSIIEIKWLAALGLFTMVFGFIKMSKGLLTILNMNSIALNSIGNIEKLRKRLKKDRMNEKKGKLFIFLFCVGIFLFSCQPKDEIISTSGDIKLSFSQDTVLFDTIFTTQGSITKQFNIYNNDKNAVEINSIQLSGNSSSPYSIIINGQETNNLSNLFLAGKDSLKILVKVTIDATNDQLPFLAKDSILLSTNGNDQYVQLISYGQNARYIKDSILDCNQIWDASLPYVIMDTVSVAEGCNLTIQPGVTLYFENNALLEINGSIQCNGKADSLITFQSEYDLGLTKENNSGSWQGINIYPTNSTSVYFHHTTLRNALNGVFMAPGSTIDSSFDIEFEQVVIENCSNYGVQLYATDAKFINTLITNCANGCALFNSGGNYHLQEVTFANYNFDFFRKLALFQANETSSFKNLDYANDLHLAIVNSILEGNLIEEIDIENYTSLFLSHNALKTMITNYNVNNSLINEDLTFTDIESNDYTLDEESILIDKGSLNWSSSIDLLGNNRSSNGDLGAYEYIVP